MIQTIALTLLHPSLAYCPMAISWKSMGRPMTTYVLAPNKKTNKKSFRISSMSSYRNEKP